MDSKKVIFDTDPGVDDAMALLFLGRARNVHLLGITTCHGNSDIDVTTRNALYLKRRFGIEVPVYKGAGEPLSGSRPASPTMIHGVNGLGDVRIPDVLDDTAEAMPAHRFIIESVRKYPKEISIVAVARMTNLALVLREAPDIASLVKEVIVMGGAFGRHGHAGNVTPVAEANIHGDPFAAEEIFAAAWPLTIVGLDVTHQILAPPSYLGEIAKRAGDAGEIIWQMTRIYEAFHARHRGVTGIYVHDAAAVARLLEPSLFSTERGPVRVVTDGFARGHTILSRPGAWGARPDMDVCVDVNASAVLEMFQQTVTGI